MKVWTSLEKTDTKIIAYFDQTIYKGNPKLADIENCVFDLKMKKIPKENFIAIPPHYLKQINLQEGKEYIEVLFGNSSCEHFQIKDIEKRNEVFEFFKTNIPNANYSVDKYSKLRAGKKPLIAMVVVAILFLWTLYIANGIEGGTEYDVSNGHYNSFAGLVLF